MSKTMKTRKHGRILVVTCALAGVILAGLALPGCTSTKVQSTKDASVGQQLQDLDKAYKDGIIDQKQYEKLKKALIKQND